VRLGLFGWFLLTDAVAAVVAAVVLCESCREAWYIGALLLARTPIVALVLLVVYGFVRWGCSRGWRIAPYAWFVAGASLGYLLCFIAISLLSEGRLFDRNLFMGMYSEWQIFLSVPGPYVLAFLVTSALYFMNPGSGRRREGEALPSGA